jgi:hypothetical protein
MSDTASEIPVLTQEMLAGLGYEIRTAQNIAGRAEAKRDEQEHLRQQAADRAAGLAATRQFIEPRLGRLGRPVAEVLEEAQAELDKAIAESERTSAAAESARERLRDLQGYQRIMQERLDELRAQEAAEDKP